MLPRRWLRGLTGRREKFSGSESSCCCVPSLLSTGAVLAALTAIADDSASAPTKAVIDVASTAPAVGSSTPGASPSVSPSTSSSSTATSGSSSSSLAAETECRVSPALVSDASAALGACAQNPFGCTMRFRNHAADSIAATRHWLGTASDLSSSPALMSASGAAGSAAMLATAIPAPVLWTAAFSMFTVGAVDTFVNLRVFDRIASASSSYQSVAGIAGVMPQSDQSTRALERDEANDGSAWDPLLQLGAAVATATVAGRAVTTNPAAYTCLGTALPRAGASLSRAAPATL